MKRKNTDISKLRDDDSDTAVVNKNYYKPHEEALSAKKKKSNNISRSGHQTNKPGSKAHSFKRFCIMPELYDKLVESEEFEIQFRKLCIGSGPEITTLKHCIANKNNIKMFLNKRYPIKICERITNFFFDSSYSSNVSQQMSFQKYCEFVSDFIKSVKHVLYNF